MKQKKYKYDIISDILEKKFNQDISNIILNHLYPKNKLNIKIINKYDILNKHTNTYQTITLYDNLGQQNCKLCGHIELIIKDIINNKFKIIILNKKYKCNCNYNNIL